MQGIAYEKHGENVSRWRQCVVSILAQQQNIPQHDLHLQMSTSSVQVAGPPKQQHNEQQRTTPLQLAQKISWTADDLPRTKASDAEIQWEEHRLLWLTPHNCGAQRKPLHRVIGTKLPEESLIIDNEYYAHPVGLSELVDYIVQVCGIGESV